VNPADIRTKMEKWAIWSARREGDTSLGWPRITIIGKLMRDMPTTRCSTCDGHGRVPGSRVGSSLAFLTCPLCNGKGKIDTDPHVRGGLTKPCGRCDKDSTGKPTGEINGKTCSSCRGTGRITNHDNAAVNPAFLRSTKQGAYIEDDQISQRIDWLICTAITEDERIVVMHEYRWSRTRLQALARLKVGDKYFRKTLADALRTIEQNL
jgi:RecJ-like exonuclease